VKRNPGISTPNIDYEIEDDSDNLTVRQEEM